MNHEAIRNITYWLFLDMCVLLKCIQCLLNTLGHLVDMSSDYDVACNTLGRTYIHFFYRYLDHFSVSDSFFLDE
jgi:hypothetical protein